MQMLNNHCAGSQSSVPFFFVEKLKSVLLNSTDSKSVYGKLNLKDQSNTDLSEFYFSVLGIIESTDNSIKEYGCMFLAVKEEMFRRASESINDYNDFILNAMLHDDNKLVREIKHSQSNQSIFLDPEMEMQIKNKDPRMISHTELPRILHASLEYTKAKVGGVGTVAESLTLKQVEAGLDARIVTPFWGFYQTDKDYGYQAEFKGFIKHEFENKSLKSSIYKIWSQDHKVAQYLIKPDPEYTNLFDVKSAANIYDEYPHSRSLDRSVFLSSAFTATAALYKGAKQQKNIDVMHYHPWTVGLAANLIKNQINPMRELLSKPPLHIIQQFHSGSFEEQGTFPLSVYKSLGIQIPTPAEFVDIQNEALLEVNAVIHVSKAIAKKAIDPEKGGPFLNASKELHSYGRLKGITNGISHADYDITSKKMYRTFAIEQEYVENDGIRTEVTDYVAHKQAMKMHLFEKGIIAHPTNPLFTFVGRFSEDKGIDVLPAMAQKIQEENGQCVIMGLASTLPEVIVYLQKKAQNSNTLKVYTKREDQTTLIDGIDIGRAIRFASDFFLIPSNNESCGLVGLEAMAAGAMPITSQVEGLRDFCYGWGDASREEEVGLHNFNSFTYFNAGNRAQNSRDAIAQAMKQYNTLSNDDKNRVLRRIVESSRSYDWNSIGGPVDQITSMYKRAMQPLTLQEKASRSLVKHAYICHRSRHSQALIEHKLNNVRNSNHLPNVGLIHFADENFNLRDPYEIHLEVKWQLLHAAHAQQNNDGEINRGDRFGFEHLEPKELACLYTILRAYCRFEERNGKSSLFQAHLQDIEEHLGNLGSSNRLQHVYVVKNFIDELTDFQNVSTTPDREDISFFNQFLPESRHAGNTAKEGSVKKTQFWLASTISACQRQL